MQKKKIIFNSKSGVLTVNKEGDLLQMDFPALPLTKIEPSLAIINAINATPDEIYQSTFDILCIMKDPMLIKQARPDLNALANLPFRGVILSSPGIESDVYSRCFYPACNVPEDPVTGSAHCVITPYWCARLNQKKIHARQGGERQGELWCEMNNDRVILSGQAQLYLQGEIVVPSSL